MRKKYVGFCTNCNENIDMVDARIVPAAIIGYRNCGKSCFIRKITDYIPRLLKNFYIGAIETGASAEECTESVIVHRRHFCLPNHILWLVEIPSAICNSQSIDKLSKCFFLKLCTEIIFLADPFTILGFTGRDGMSDNEDVDGNWKTLNVLNICFGTYFFVGPNSKIRKNIKVFLSKADLIKASIEGIYKFSRKQLEEFFIRFGQSGFTMLARDKFLSCELGLFGFNESLVQENVRQLQSMLENRKSYI
jgi:hypothetical protein